jgi:ADP-ribose pyrophosphatase YjhB (NUDIX family)
LDVPGGFIDLHETAEEAAYRELKEEMGISATNLDYLGSYTTSYSDGRLLLNMTYVTQYPGGPITPGDDMSGGDPVWRSIHNLPTVDELAWDWYLAAHKDLLQWWHQRRQAE